MIKIFIFVLATLAAIVLGPHLSNHQGLVHIATSQYIIETSITTAIIVIVVSFILMYMAIRFIIACIKMPRDTSRFFNRFFINRSSSMQHEACIAFEECEYERAYALCKKAGNIKKLHYFTKLIMAKSAFELGFYDKTSEILDILKEDKKLVAACTILRARLNLKIGNAKAALETLDTIKDSYSSRTVTKLTFDSYMMQENYDEVAILIPTLIKQGIIKPEDQNGLYKLFIDKKLTQVKSREDLDLAIKSIPKALLKKPAIIGSILNSQIKFGDLVSAKKYCMDLIKNRLDSELLESIAKWEMSIPEVLKALLTIESKNLIASQVNVPLLKAIGNLELKAGLLDDAKNHFEKALEISKSSDIYFNLGYIMAQMRYFDKASEYYALANTSQKA